MDGKTAHRCVILVLFRVEGIDMDGNEQVRTCLVGLGGPLLQFGIGILVARHHDFDVRVFLPD